MRGGRMTSCVAVPIKKSLVHNMQQNCCDLWQTVVFQRIGIFSNYLQQPNSMQQSMQLQLVWTRLKSAECTTLQSIKYNQRQRDREWPNIFLIKTSFRLSLNWISVLSFLFQQQQQFKETSSWIFWLSDSLWGLPFCGWADITLYQGISTQKKRSPLSSLENYFRSNLV